MKTCSTCPLPFCLCSFFQNINFSRKSLSRKIACLLCNSPLISHRLAKHLIQVTQLKPEPWIAMGHFCNLTNRKPRAVYFAQKVQYCCNESQSYNRRKSILLKGHNQFYYTVPFSILNFLANLMYNQFKQPSVNL